MEALRATVTEGRCAAGEARTQSVGVPQPPLHMLNVLLEHTAPFFLISSEGACMKSASFV